MTMEIVKQNVEKKEPRVKAMYEMETGEVCWCEMNLHYILKTNRYVLILDNHENINGYSPGTVLQVRELYPGESITIKFS